VPLNNLIAMPLGPVHRLNDISIMSFDPVVLEQLGNLQFDVAAMSDNPALKDAFVKLLTPVIENFIVNDLVGRVTANQYRLFVLHFCAYPHSFWDPANFEDLIRRHEITEAHVQNYNALLVQYPHLFDGAGRLDKSLYAQFELAFLDLDACQRKLQELGKFQINEPLVDVTPHVFRINQALAGM